MAAPSDVRVYATSQTSVEIRWTYPGSSQVAVYRSTDGSSYSEITVVDLTRVAVGTTLYIDATLNPGTKYWYKLSDDAGSTFSSAVTVYSHTCLEPGGDSQTMILPRTNGQSPVAEFDELAERVETALNGRVLNPSQCVACPADGTVVIDCSQGCNDWVVVADEDINSVTINWCGEGEGNIEFILPPNTSGRKVCGFPAGFGLTGDECFQAPVSSGAAGASMNVGFGGGGKASPGKSQKKTGYSKGVGNGGGSGSACNCVPGANGQLTIKSCNANNSLNCSGSKSLKLIACGGRPPYTWSKTGSVTLSNTSGTTTTVRPPTNSGSGESGTAYSKYGGICVNGGGVQVDCPGAGFASYSSQYGCNDQVLSACGQVFSGVNSGNCSSIPLNLGNGSCSSITPCYDGGSCSGGTCDARTAGMISAGCVPCGVNAGATVTVTDNIGTQTTIILKS